MLKDFEGCCFSKMTNNVINVAFSPDSSLVAFRWDDAVRIMNLSTLEVEKELKNGHSWVTAAFSPDGKMIAIGGTKDLLSIYDLSKDSSVALIKAVEARIHQHVQVSKDYHYKQTVEPKWAPDSVHIVTRWNNKVRVYKVEYDNVTLSCELEHKS